MVSLIFKCLVLSSLIVAVFGFIWYVSLSTTRRMQLTKIPRCLYVVWVIVFVFILFATNATKEALCNSNKDIYQVEETKYSFIKNKCLLKDPISGRFVVVENYGRG